jgi:hypothetical protein
LCIIASWATEILRLLAQKADKKAVAQVKMTRAARRIGELFPPPPPQENFVFFKPNPAFYTHF